MRGLVMFLFGVGIPDLGMQLLKLLAVVGGIAIGTLGTGWVVQLTCKLTAQRKPPQLVLRVLRVLGGLALGLAVWLWVFSPAGGGGIGGSGFGLFAGGAGQGNGSETVSDSASKDKKPDGEPDRPKTAQETLRIVMLGGDRVTADRFYLIEGEKEPRTLAEIETAIDQRQPKAIDIVIYLDSVAESHPKVAELKQRATERELTVKITKPGTHAPP